MHWGTQNSAFSRFGKQAIDPYNDGGQQIEGGSAAGAGWGGAGVGGWGGGGPAASPLASPPHAAYGALSHGGAGIGPAGIENDNPAAIADIQSTRGLSGEWHSGTPLHYAQGGAIDEATGSVNTGGMGDFGARLQSGVKLAQEMLNHSRQRFGIGGQQEAANRMPVSPGTQSESGMPKTQPMPGPLPPTNNPFGKRAEADPDNDGDTAAIDTDDDQEQA